jgi:hypothetical protein
VHQKKRRIIVATLNDRRDASLTFRDVTTIEAINLQNQQRHAAGPSSPRTRSIPRNGEVRALIEAARQHPLGLDFLETGSLDAVAAMFSVHAFVVEEARASLGSV